MSQWVFFEAKAPPHLQRMRYVISNLIGLKHLLVLFVIATFLTLGLVNNAGRVTAEVLFQSPQSPPAQPESPIQQAPPAQTVGYSTFGVVSAQANNPRLVQLGLRLSY